MKATLDSDKVEHWLTKMQKKVLNPGGVEIYFNNTTEKKKAERHEYGIGITATPFFSLSKKQLRKATKKVGSCLKREKNIRRNLYALGGKLITEISKRTRNGKSPDGSRQRNYDPKYLAKRSEKGRKGNPVRLYFTGNMLKAISRRIIKK